MDAWEGEILLWKFWVLEIAFEEVNRNHEKSQYGVATISRLLEIIGLFCKRALYKRLYSAKETWNFEEPTYRSYPIVTRDSLKESAP